MIILGVTGGSGSGKSYVSKLICENDGLWIDADKVYHTLLEKSVAMRNAILKEFPEAEVNGEINRKKLASMVFTNDRDLMKLNRITHPFVIENIEKQISECYCTNVELVVVDAIALFESGLSKICDKVIGVIASDECRLSRIVARDNISVDRARARINAQQKNDFYKKKCDYIIENSENSPLEYQVSDILNEIFS